MKFFILLRVLVIFSPLLSFIAVGQTLNNAELVSFVKAFVKDNIHLPAQGRVAITVPSIDPRITIKPCDFLQAKMPDKKKGSNLNVKVYCEGNNPWKIYLPVKVNQQIPILVTQNILAKGTVIDHTNTVVEFIDANRIRGESINNVQSIAGGRLKRRLSKGAIISPRNICLVCKGGSVTIFAKSNDFMVKTIGLAMSDGSMGQQVKIKNSKSGRIINARVDAVNKVVINL